VWDYADQPLRQLSTATPPKKGEEFQVIADDFQNIIVPGKDYPVTTYRKFVLTCSQA